MGSILINLNFSFLVFFFLVLGFASSSTHISHRVLQAQKTDMRGVPEFSIPCKHDFKNMNYTIITSKCKGPESSKKDCCDALLAFACPIADIINDDKTDCAALMFCTIRQHGDYPPSMFINMCKNGTHALNCPEM
ncbi:GPI-anchored protein LLG3-like [Hibiscus syriacus]|uniref:GPI-anchored protein LLG3-like n=1 Tax=Hibiscus syriacus TaxID=106335 RepID=UPI0019242142|nr:GPI-anchored protein LLG3-like [Hibiscus syriacus]